MKILIIKTIFETYFSSRRSSILALVHLSISNTLKNKSQNSQMKYKLSAHCNNKNHSLGVFKLT